MSEAVLAGRLQVRVGHRTLPFAPTCFDAELLSAADAAVARGVPLGMVLPLPGTVTPLLLGAASVVGAVLARHALDVQVAVASANIKSRILYDRLYVHDQRLADFIPRTWIDADGQPRLVRKPVHDAGGRLHLTGALERLASLLPDLDGLVVDARTTTPRELSRMVSAAAGPLSVLYLTADPGDPALGVLRDAGGVVWGWDSKCLGPLAAKAITSRTADAGPLAADMHTLRAASSSTVTVACPSGGELDLALAQLWHSLGGLSAAYRVAADRRGGHAVEATRWAWGVFNVLAMLPIAPPRYDLRVPRNPFALRLGPVVQIARAYARNVEGAAREAWYEVADAFADALTAAGRQEKLGPLLDWMETRVNAGQHALLAVRNPPAAAAVRAALDESTRTNVDWADCISIVTIAELAAGRFDHSATELCVPGTLPRNRSGLLALPPVVRVTVVTSGPLEAHRALRQAYAVRKLLADMRAETAGRSAKMLGIQVRCQPSGEGVAFQVRLDEHGKVRAATPEDLGPDGTNPWEPFSVDVLAVLQDTVSTSRDDATYVAPARVGTSGSSTLVRVIAVHFAAGIEGAILLTAPNDLVTRRRGPEVQRVAAKSLAVGDVVLLIDRASHQDLLDSVAAKLSESPTYGALSSLIEFWHQRARRPHESGTAYREILRRMYGTSITSEQTIGTWVRGEVDGPRDPDDVKRFALAIHDSELSAQAERVSWALKTLHRVRHKIGAWLSAQAREATTADADADEIIDAELDIHVADLLDTVSAHQVTLINTSAQVAPAATLGILLTRAEALHALRPTPRQAGQMRRIAQDST